MGMKKTISIQIANVTDAQIEALQDLLATWQQLGSLGASRWTAFYADGDGDFRPRIIVNGEPAVKSKYVTKEQTWPALDKRIRTEYQIDYDWIAWKLREEREAAGRAPQEP